MMNGLAILYRPVLPIWLIAVVGVVVLGLCLWLAIGYERRPLLFTLRVLGIAAVVWALLGPIELVDSIENTGQKPRVELLIDTSLSMQQPDAGSSGDIPRLDYARQTWLTDDNLDQLRQRADIVIRRFDEGISAGAVSDQPVGKETFLYDAVAQRRGDATVVLSDGHDTTGRGTPSLPGGIGRLYAVPIGSARRMPDLAVQAWTDADLLYSGQSTTLTTQLYQHGLAGNRVRVLLNKDGQTIDSQELTIDHPLATVSFNLSPQLPPNQPMHVAHYEVVAQLADGDEALTENNRQDVFVQISRERIRVLLLEGQPHWETRGLARVLSQSPRFVVQARYALGEQRRLRVEQDEGTQHTQDTVRGYDVVVLGRGVERLLTPDQAEELARFVQNDGGAVVLARGQPASESTAQGRAVLEALAPILPVRFGDELPYPARLAVAAESSNHPLSHLGQDVQLSRLPGMLAATRVEGRKAASVVVLESDGTAASPAAAVITMQAGRGAVLAVLTDGLWRWELASPTQDMASAYATFWTRAIQWLAAGGEFLPGQDIALQLSSMTAQPGEVVQATVSTRYVDPLALQVQLDMIAPDGSRVTLDSQPSQGPSGLHFSILPEQLGLYRLELVAPGRPDLIAADHPIHAQLAVLDRSAEQRDTAARPDILKALTQPTGGQCLEPDEIAPVLDYLDTLTRTRTADPQPRDLFDRWQVFSLIAGCFGLQWILRRRGGLL